MIEWCCRLLERQGDSTEDVHIKKVATPVCVFLVLFASVAATASVSTLAVLSNLMIVIPCGLFVLNAFLNLVTARHMADGLLLCCAVALCSKDLVNAAVGSSFRSWSFIVLLLDAALIFNRNLIPPIVIPFTLVYVAAQAVEGMFPYGLYEAAAVGGKEAVRSCDCADPPCAQTIIGGITGWVSVCSIFLIDFYFTRGFAIELRLQLERVKSSVDVAVEIAAALAKYDVDVAEEAITNNKNLPEELAASFRQLLFNLRSYKAYLPHSCLVPQEEGLVQRDSPSTNRSSDAAEAAACVSPVSDDEVAGLHTRPSTLTRPDNRSSCRSSESSLSPDLTSAYLKAAKRRTRVSLAAGNMIGYNTRFGDMAGPSNIEWIATDVERWCTEVGEAKGVVDVIGGDRRYASFNARRQCIRHAAAAVEVLSSRGTLGLFKGWTGCVVSGPVVCGSFGCATTMRFMVLGGVAASLHPFERLAARWGIKVLADGDTYSTACQQWRGLLLGAVFLHKRRGVGALRVYRMTSKRRDDTPPEHGLFKLMEVEPDENAFIRNKIDEELRHLHSIHSDAGPFSGWGCGASSMDGSTPPHTPQTDDAEDPTDGAEDTILWKVSEVGLVPC
eukprot:Hpha_TRINITY_DN16323_c4_g1::TRINITY_DN16323_c4_g1_i4::g.60800::m.60800